MVRLKEATGRMAINTIEREEGVLHLLALLANMVSYEGDDKIFSPHDSSGHFSVKSYCRKMYKVLSTVISMLSCLNSQKREGSNGGHAQKAKLQVG